MKKRFISALLLAVMLVGLLPLWAFASSDKGCEEHAYDHAYDKVCNNVGCEYEREIRMQSALLLGQSNMAGRGDLDTVSPISDDRIFMMRNDGWVKMQEPIHEGERAAACLGASFANAFVQTFDCQLGLIPSAVGGTSLNDWQVDGTLYNTAVEKAKRAQQTSDICAILWHQGESDQKNENYAKELKVIFDALIEELGLDKDKIVIITGELFGTRSDEVHLAQLESLASEYKNYGVAYSDGLTVFDVTTHFDAPSLRVLGYRYFDIFHRCITGEPYYFDDDPKNYYMEPDLPEFTNPIISENWNDDATGNAISVSGKTVYTANGGEITVGELSGNEKYLNIKTGIKSGSSYGDSFVDFYKTISTGSVVVLEAKFKLGGELNAHIDLFKTIDKNGVAMRTLRVKSNGKLYNMSGSDSDFHDDLGCSLDRDEWTKVRVILDLENNVKNIYVHGKLVLISAINETGMAQTELKRQRIVQFVGTTIGSSELMVDDFACYLGTFDDVKYNIDYLANESFDSLSADTVYTEKTTVDNITVNNVSEKSYIKVLSKDGRDNYLEITRAENKGTYFELNSPAAANARLVFEAELRRGDKSLSADLFKLVMNNSATYNLLYLQNGALCDYVYKDGVGATGEELYTLSKDEWTRVKVVCDLKYNTKDVYINDTLVKTGLAIHESPTADVKMKTCRVIYARGNGTLFVDNVSYYEQERPVDIVAHSLTLAGDIAVNTYLSALKKENANDIVAKFTVDGAVQEYRLSDVEITDGRYKLICKVHSTQMTTDIQLEIYVGGILAVKDTYSVVEYANEILTNDVYVNARPLVKAMLNYGAAAQVYFSEKNNSPSIAENLANASLNDADRAVPEINVQLPQPIFDGDRAYYANSATFVLKDKLTLKIYYEGNSDGCSVTVKTNGTEVDIDGFHMDASADEFAVVIGDILPNCYGVEYTVTLTAKDGGTSTVTLSVNSIIGLIITDSTFEYSDSFRALATALYNYHTCSLAYENA